MGFQPGSYPGTSTNRKRYEPADEDIGSLLRPQQHSEVVLCCPQTRRFSSPPFTHWRGLPRQFRVILIIRRFSAERMLSPNCLV